MKQKFLFRMVSFIAALAASTLWLLFVIDIWENGSAITLPYEVYYIVRYANTPYIISAGLPIVTLCLVSAVPRTLKKIFTRYASWKKWYACAAGLLLAVQTVCMLPAGRWFVSFARSFLRFGIMETMITCYVHAIVPALVICVICWLSCMLVETKRSSDRIRQTARQNAMYLACSVAIAFLFTVASLLLLNVLSFYHVVNKGWINSFCTHNASNISAAWISVICAPLVEETAFRGLICKGLGKYGHRWPAIVISAVFFGMWHRNVTQFAYTFVWGVILGYVVMNVDSILWPMLMHGLSNLLAILAYSDSPNMVFGAWPALVALREWLADLPMAFSVVLLIISIVALAMVVRFFRESREQTLKKSACAGSIG